MALVVAAIIMVAPVAACVDNGHTVNVSIVNILSQVQWMTQQQQQAQQQVVNVAAASGTSNSWLTNTGISDDLSHVGGIVQTSETYSRLVYPGEVLTFPVTNGSTCTLLAGLPVGFYTIGPMYGESEYKIQTSESAPTYDPIYHRMDFGYVPPVDKINYWTMKARLKVSPTAAFCVVDNRAPMNGYTTIEVVVS